MKILTMEQGTHEWEMARLGVPTASKMDSILTPKTRKPSGGRPKYRAELLAEWLLGQPLDAGSSSFMARGTEMEDRARKWYELQYDVDVEQVGFILRDDEAVGCSPDGLVGDTGGLEIKCPAAVTHVAALLGDMTDHVGQCQTAMYLTDRSWWDVLSFNPDLPPVVNRVLRDNKYIEALVPVLDEFVVTLTKEKIRLAEHKVVRPWDLEAAMKFLIGKLRKLVERAEGLDAELISYDERERIEKAIAANNEPAIKEWIEDLEKLPWEKFETANT